MARKFTIYALGKFQVQVPWAAYIQRGDLTDGFLRYDFGGLIFGVAYTRRGLFSEFYGMPQVWITKLIVLQGEEEAMSLSVIYYSVWACLHHCCSFNPSLGDVTRDDSQWRFLPQHSNAMLEQCCNHLKQCCNAVLRYKSLFPVISCNISFVLSCCFKVISHVNVYPNRALLSPKSDQH